jgi:hypothetical protein
MILKRKILSIFLFLLLFGSISNITIADTGTYTILDYSVKLTPHSDGTVEIEYYQKWLVTGGHIPWITIGTANSNYRIDQSKNRGNIRSIYAYNSSRWSGVRIDLDKDYLPDETFEVRFTLIQSKLFYADKENYKLDFTPGWYDRAITEKLTVVMHIFAPIDKVKVSPENARIEGEEIIWEVANLGRGGRFSVSVSFPKSFMPEASTSALKSRRTSRGSAGLFVFIVMFILIGTLVAIVAGIRAGGYGGGGSLFAAGSGSRSGRSTGGGGGFGGRSSSCACACASCACACACAGGGGAGCSKKTSHSCPICSEAKKI